MICNKRQESIIPSKDKHLLLKYNKYVPGIPFHYCPLTSHNGLSQRIGWLLPPPSRLVPGSLTVQWVALVQGGGPAIKQWMELVQEEEENRHRKTGDNGSLPQLF